MTSDPPSPADAERQDGPRGEQDPPTLAARVVTDRQATPWHPDPAEASATPLVPSLLLTADGQEPSPRLCPSCGERTAAQACPRDGIPTVDLQAVALGSLDFRPGDLIGRSYKVVRSLGRGAFGQVFRCEHISTQQPVAVKVLSLPAEALQANEIRRFYQEAAVTARLTHPNTVRVQDFGQTEQGPLFLAMEFLHGKSLATLMQERFARGEVLTARQAAWIGKEILRSLQEAHGLGLVHRDIKPANIMVFPSSEGDRLKVLDFGIVRKAESSLTTMGILGTPSFMSPEQTMGEELDGRSDLYAVGVLLYLALAGRAPFDGAVGHLVMEKHRSAPAPDLRKVAPQPVPDALADVVMRALAKKPSRRYVDAAEMRAALEAAMGDGPESGLGGLAEPEPGSGRGVAAPSPRRGRGGGRGRWWWVAGGAAVATAATATVLLGGRRQPEAPSAVPAPPAQRGPTAGASAPAQAPAAPNAAALEAIVELGSQAMAAAAEPVAAATPTTATPPTPRAAPEPVAPAAVAADAATAKVAPPAPRQPARPGPRPAPPPKGPSAADEPPTPQPAEPPATPPPQPVVEP